MACVILAAAACSPEQIKEREDLSLRWMETYGRVEMRVRADIDRIVMLRNKYCEATTEGAQAVLKGLVIGAIRTQIPLYPAEGICTDLFDQTFSMIPSAG